MKLSTYTMTGFFLLYLNSQTSWASPSYQFLNGECFSVSGQNWVKLAKCPQTNYSFKHSLGLFCQYNLSANESIESALKNTRYYRAKNMTRAIKASTGVATVNKPPNINKLLLSKRDLLSKNENLCSKPNEVLENSAYILHIPNSLYVLKSGLSQIKKKSAPFKKAAKTNSLEQKIKKTKDSNTKQTLSSSPYKYKKNNKNSFRKYSLNAQPELFYDILQGKQLSNGSTADLSSKLSTGLKLQFNLNEEKKFYYGVFTDLKFHLYNEKADELLLANNSIHSLEFGLNATYKLNRLLSLSTSVSGIEDVYYKRLSAVQIGFEKELLPRFKLSSDLAALQTKRFRISVEPTFIYDLSSGDLKAGFGFESPLKFRFTSNRQNWSLILNYRSIKKDLTDLELKRNFLSASLLAGFKF